VGVYVVQELQARALPDDVEVVDGGTLGLGIVPLLEGRRRVVMVDAAEMGEAPGEFARFRLDEAQLLGDERHLSVHSAGPRDALLLAQALKVLPQEVIIYGVQPANVEWDSALSPQVQAVLPKLTEAVLAEAVVEADD
jgi:hydrogenase maturation protease